MFGFLNIDKPKGMTSRDVVTRVQRYVKPLKAGHAGTLDPLASGVLIVAVGAATRLIPYAQRLPKHYQAQFVLGKSSPGGDLESGVITHADLPQPTRSELLDRLDLFRGEILQRPPTHSAIKVAGQRAYRLARQGKDVELQPRPVVVHSIELTRFEYPTFELEIVCGSGTYIRSIGRDLANELGTKAVMSELRRKAIGAYDVGDAISCDSLNVERIRECLQSPITVLDKMRRTIASHTVIDRLRMGQRCEMDEVLDAGEHAILDEAGHLVALATFDSSTRQMIPMRVFPADS